MVVNRNADLLVNGYRMHPTATAHADKNGRQRGAR